MSSHVKEKHLANQLLWNWIWESGRLINHHFAQKQLLVLVQVAEIYLNSKKTEHLDSFRNTVYLKCLSTTKTRKSSKSSYLNLMTHSLCLISHTHDGFEWTSKSLFLQHQMKDNINTFISVNWLKVAPAPIQPISKLSLVNKVVPIMKVWSVLKETSSLASGKSIDPTYGFTIQKIKSRFLIRNF